MSDARDRWNRFLSMPIDELAAGIMREDWIGRHLGSYEIVALLGAGGMGEVYRARDAKLDRDVAIKVLPSDVVAGAERLARFGREAKTLASLNHPNIAQIYGVEDSTGTPALVMELVEGPTLADRIAKGPIPLDDALPIAKQIAEALEAAHEQGIIHRDLKPANVKVRPDGTVKVLDFGVAKAMPPAAAAPANAMKPPTIIAATRRGVILGTAAYMSPEQAAGKPIDKRSDLWSFGVVVMEMLTGRPVFTGETVSHVLAAVLTAEPDWATLPAETPASIRKLLQRCLQRNRKNRLADAADARLEIEDAISTRSGAWKTRTRVVAAFMAGGAAALIVGGIVVIRSKSGIATTPSASYKQVTFVGDARFPAVSPDGQFLAYAIGSGADQKVIVHDLAGDRTLEVFRANTIWDLRWSPDGATLAVPGLSGSSNAIYLVPRLGGAARALPAAAPRVSWSPDGSQIVEVGPGAKSLFFVARATGAVTPMAIDAPVTFMLDVDWSPVGGWLLFAATDSGDHPTVWIVKPDGSGLHKILEEESGLLTARWASTGDAIYYLKGTPTQELWKVSLSSRSGELVGPPLQLLSGLDGATHFSAFRDGRHLAYVGRTGHSNLWLGSFDVSRPDGVQTKELTTGTQWASAPSFSPDGERIAYSRGDGATSNIFVLPAAGGPPQQLTFLKSVNAAPVWSRDGRTIAFGSTEGGAAKIWHVSTAGGQPRPYARTRVSANSFSMAWAPGRDLLYQQPGNRNFSILDQREAESPLATDDRLGWTYMPSYSPDGKTLVVGWNRPPGPGLYIMPLDGSGPREQRARRISGPPTFGGIGQSVNAVPYRGKDVKLTVHVRTLVTDDSGAQCWLRVDRSNGQRGFFDNMRDRPIRTPDWSAQEIVGNVDADADGIAFGCFLTKTGRIWVDEVQLSYRTGAGAWAPISIRNPGFEDGEAGREPGGWNPSSVEYTARVVSEAYKGKRSVQISSTRLFAGQLFPIGWSPDARHVYAYDANDARRILAVPVEGGEATPFLTLPVPEGRMVMGSRISPDGRHVVYVVGESTSDIRVVTNFDPAARTK